MSRDEAMERADNFLLSQGAVPDAAALAAFARAEVVRELRQVLVSIEGLNALASDLVNARADEIEKGEG